VVLSINGEVKMAGSSLFALLDDIATVLDDVALMSKVAAKKTAGVLGDDLALNAQQVSGVRADRELPVVWLVAKGSFINKLILVPLALTISALAPQLISPLLIIGGLYLCFEGVEKIWHSFFHKNQNIEHKKSLHTALIDSQVDLVEFERTKIKGAIRTDFVLSAEIIVIALGTVTNESLMTQGLVVGLIALLMTVGVYGVVAFIVKLDDMGLYLIEGESVGRMGVIKKLFGRLILAFCPFLMKGLSIIGTAAMFLVGGGIIVHGVGFLHHFVEGILATQYYAAVIEQFLNFVIGMVSGAVLLALLKCFKALKNKII
jgi:predicted DNA repair protein MutK